MILIIDPTVFIESRYSNRNDIFFFQVKENLFFHFSEGKKVQYSAYTESYEFISDIDVPIEHVVKKIDEWSPIWARWVAQSDQYELMKRDALKFVVDFACFLKSKDIKSAVFFTAVSHHISYSLIELACQISKVNQIFLYPIVFGSGTRLLPMMQSESLLDRRPIGVEVSYVNMFKAVNDFVEKAKLGCTPVASEAITKYSSNQLIATTYLIRKSLRNLLDNLIINNIKNTSKSKRLFVFPDHGFVAGLRMLRNQSEALKFYKSKALSTKVVTQLIESNEVLPLVAAHYQPEATTFPEGWSYRDHIDIVIEIRRLGYKGVIFYKEHPASSIFYSKIVGLPRVGMSRSVGYYKNLLDLGCVFLPQDFPVNVVLPSKVIIITITGSIALERALSGMSTCCAGRPWFFGMPGIYSLQEAFESNGLFFDSSKRLFDSGLAMNFINRLISYKTLTNATGIGSGIPSKSDGDHLAFAVEFDKLINELTNNQKIV